MNRLKRHLDDERRYITLKARFPGPHPRNHFFLKFRMAAEMRALAVQAYMDGEEAKCRHYADLASYRPLFNRPAILAVLP